MARLGAQDLNLNVVGTAAGALTLDHSGVTVVDVVPETDATASQTATTALTLTNSTAVDLYVGEDSVYTGNVIANQAESLEVAVEGQLNNQLTATNATGAVFNLQNADDASTVDLEANKLVSLDVTAAGDANFNGSSLNGLEALVVNTAGHFQTDAALGAINQIELSGNGQATVNGALGAADQDAYGITVSATGLNDGLTLGTMDTNGTNITVSAADVLGAVTLGAINARSGDVSVDLSNVGGAIQLNNIAGANVTVDATGALGAVDYNGTGNDQTITASESATLNGAELAANTAVINSGSATFTGTLNGGLEADTYTVNLTNTDATRFNLSGDLGLGADELTITLAEQADNGEVTATYNVAGVETLNFDLGAADNDTITLTAASSLAGVETLTVNDGTVDISAVTDFTGNKVEVASGIKMTAAQFASLTTLDAAADSTIEITVNSDEEAQAVQQAFNDLTLVGGTEPRVRLNVSTAVSNDARTNLETAADNKSSSVTTTTIDDSGNAGDTVANGVLTVQEATDATSLGAEYSIVDTAEAIQGLIDAADPDGDQTAQDANEILAGADAITSNDDPDPLALNVSVSQQTAFSITTEYNIVDVADVIADALVASNTAFNGATGIAATTAVLTAEQADALEIVANKAIDPFEYTVNDTARLIVDNVGNHDYINATGITASTSELSVSDALVLEGLVIGSGSIAYTLVDSAEAIAFELDGDTNAFENAVSITTNDTSAVELNVAQATALNTAEATIQNGYNLSDTATALASSDVLNGAMSITASDAANVVQAETIADATNTGPTSFNVGDELSSVLNVAASATANSKNGLADAGTITINDLAGGSEVVEFDSLNADAAAAIITFVNMSATLSQTELGTITAANLSLNDADAITVTGVTTLNGDFTNAAAIDLLDNNDTITFDGNAATLDAVNYNDVFGAGISATAGDEIIVTMGGLAVAGSAANDTFAFAGNETGANVTNFGMEGVDTIDLSAVSATTTTTEVTGTLTTTAGTVYFLSTGTAGDADTDAAAATAINTAATWTDADAEAFVVIADDDSSAIYKFTDTGTSDNGVADTELTLIGTVDAVLTSDDIALNIV